MKTKALFAAKYEAHINNTRFLHGVPGNTLPGREKIIRALSAIGEGFIRPGGTRSFDPIYRANHEGLQTVAYMPFYTELGELCMDEREYRRIRRALRKRTWKRLMKLQRKGVSEVVPKAYIVLEGGRPGQVYHYYRGQDSFPFDLIQWGISDHPVEDFCWGATLHDIVCQLAETGFMRIRAHPVRRWEDMETEELELWYGSLVELLSDHGK